MWRAARGSGCSTAGRAEAGAWASAAGAHASTAPIAARIARPLTAALPARITRLGAFCNWHEALVRLVEREPALPFGVERDLERRGERRVLDHHHGQVEAAEHRILHAEHDIALVDDDQLERELGHETRLLAGLDEGANALDRRRVVEDRELVDRARLERARHLEALLLLLRRRRVGRLREDEDLVVDVLLELAEALVDRAAVAQDLDVVERVGDALARLERPGGRHRLHGVPGPGPARLPVRLRGVGPGPCAAAVD